MEVLHLLFCCFFLLLHPSVNNAQPYRNISLGSTLAGNSSWISPSGEFSFGFSVLGTSLYAGIRYEKIPGKPLVWTTNREPAPPGSTIELTSDGRFVLKDGKNVELSVIAAGWGVGNVSYAAMLDTGNLVLVGSTPSDYRWQSFDYPTNTILPTQNLALDYKLYAGFSPTNLSTGRHFIVMQTDGNFVGYTAALREPTYASNTDGTPGKLMFDETGSLYLLQAQKNTTINLTPLDKIPKPAKNFYHRATMDWDGVFRQYSYPKTTQNGEWTENWNVVWSTNTHPCVVKGMCGSNGYCVYGSGQDFSCLCPQGFSYIDPNQPVVGCRQDWKGMDCRSYDRGDYLLQTIDSVNWDGSYESLSVDESACREACLADCECVVAVYGSSSCNKKRMPMRNGGPVSDGGTKALIKVPRDNRTLVSPPLPPFDGSGRGLNPSNTTSMENGRRRWISIAVATGSVLGSLNLILLVGCILLCIMWQKDRRWRQRSVFGPSKSGMQLTSFSYEELKKVTDGFKEKLGGGSFGTVYKGFLNLGAGSGRKSVAVKQLDNKLVEEGEKEFRTEVSVIGRTHHKNLVKLHGFCDEGSHRLLVYEYMEQGSLSSFLFGSTRPEWNQRVKIATGIARGLMYLHEECETQIIHCDIKPGNILIDGNFVPKLADFGLAKLLRHDQTKTNTNIRGTKGYVAPEWFRKMAITVKVDVYSYGVMLLELICCRKNVNLADLDDPSAILVDWAYDCFVGKQLIKLVEDDEDAADDLKKVEKMVMVALWCIQEEPSLRPTMKKVTQMLEGAVEVAVPPSPSSFISSMG